MSTQAKFGTNFFISTTQTLDFSFSFRYGRNTMKYILYARKSSEEKGRQLLSLPSQVSTMKKLADTLGLNIVKVFAESKSAKEPGNRPMFAEMIRMLEEGEADGIVCWKPDRLSRNPIDSGNIQWLSQQGVIKDIQTSDRRYLPDDNALLFSIESSMANQYIRDLSKNVKRGMKTKLEKGGYPNYAKIGYINDRLNKTILVDTERAPFIKRAFELYATGSYSLKKISDLLFQEGFRSRSGYKYRKGRIQKILKDPFYHGIMYVHGIYYSGNHKTLISKELFEKTQDIFTGKNKSRYKKHFFPLRGFMNCHSCGCLMTAMEKKGFTYYYCTNGKGNCEAHKRYLRSEEVEKILASIFRKIHFDEEFIELCYEADREKSKRDGSFFETMKANLEKRHEALAQQEMRLLDIQLAGKYAGETVDAKLEAFNKETAEIQQRLKELEKHNPETVARTLEQVKKVFLSASGAEKDFVEGDDMKKRKVLETVLLNATIVNGEMASYTLKQPYQMLEKAGGTADIEQMRKGWDSNPRYPFGYNSFRDCPIRPL